MHCFHLKMIFFFLFSIIKKEAKIKRQVMVTLLTKYGRVCAIHFSIGRHRKWKEWSRADQTISTCARRLVRILSVFFLHILFFVFSFFLFWCWQWWRQLVVQTISVTKTEKCQCVSSEWNHIFIVKDLKLVWYKGMVF